MNASKLEKILADHALWMKNTGGSRANLRKADLRRADLRWASLQRADLQRANLREADLREADLREADLQGADLEGADLRETKLPDFQICPEEGAFFAWKKLANGVVAKICVPAEAARTSTLVSRKCRAAFVIPVAMHTRLGLMTNTAPGWRNRSIIYRLSEPTHADKFDPDIRVDCTHGIHFFMTRKEAENW